MPPFVAPAIANMAMIEGMPMRKNSCYKKKFYIPEEDKWITIKICSSALKSVNKYGISAVIKKAKEKGTLNI